MQTEQQIQDAADEHYTSRFDGGNGYGRWVRLIERAQKHDHYTWADELRTALEESVLCVDLVAIYPSRDTCEWEILLGTGGPADRVLVTTSFNGDVEDAKYQHQDWFTPWTDAENQDYELVERFAQVFYFGTVADWTESLARR